MAGSIRCSEYLLTRLPKFETDCLKEQNKRRLCRRSHVRPALQQTTADVAGIQLKNIISEYQYSVIDTVSRNEETSAALRSTISNRLEAKEDAFFLLTQQLLNCIIYNTPGGYLL